MIQALTVHRPFVIGTTGWTADDLDRPDVSSLWDDGNYEIIEGALVSMPAAYYDATKALRRVVKMVERHLENLGTNADFSFEPDVVLSSTRVVKADAAYLSTDDERKQKRLNRRRRGEAGRLTYGRLRVPPSLIIENISIGHEAQDRVVKFRWYAEAKVPNYWILDVFRRLLDCYVLEGKVYRLDQSGRRKEIVRPSAFKGLAIDLAQIWAD